MEVLVDSIASTYFSGFHCVVIIDLMKPPDLLPKLTCTKSSCPNFGCLGFMISSAKILEDLEKQLQRSQRRFNNRRYLIVSPNREEVTEVFKLEAIRDVKDLLVVAPKGNVFELLTHKFTGDEAAQSSPVLLDVWFPQNQSFAFNADLYPDKTKDLQGRTLIMSTFTYRPYAMIGDSLGDSNGIEIRLISEYQKRRNLSATLRVRQDELWGIPRLNGTGMGVMGAVASGQSDLGFCGLYLWFHAYIFVDFSATTMRSGIKCLVPKPREALGLLAAFDQFSLRIWVLILGALLTSAFVLFSIQRLQRQTSSNESMALGKIVLLVCGLFVTQSMPHQRVFRNVKAVFICVCLFCLIIDFSYSSNLASKLVVPRYEKGIESPQDLADSNLKWIGRDEHTWVGIFKTFPEPRFQKFTANFIEYKDMAKLKERASTGRFAIPVLSLQSGNYAIDDFIDDVTLEKLGPMKEEVHWMHSGIILKRNSVFLESLNELILRALASGLVSHWESQAIVFNSSLKLQNMLKYSGEKTHGQVELKFRHVRGIFAAWILGLSLSSLAFIYEILQ